MPRTHAQSDLCEQSAAVTDRERDADCLGLPGSSLTLAFADTTPPGLPSLTDPLVLVWPMAHGQITGVSRAGLGEQEVWLTGVGYFHFCADSRLVTVVPCPSTPREAVLDAYRRAIRPLALQALGLEVLHASAVHTPRGVYALCGPSLTGKSTLAYGLSRRGYALWADDAVVLCLSSRSVVALPLSFRIHLRPAAAAFFGGPFDATSGVVDEQEDAVQAGVAPLAAVVLLVRDAEGDGPAVASTLRLAPAQAFRPVLAQACCFDLLDSGRKGRLIHQYLNLVARVPVYEVRFQPGVERIPLVLDSLQGLLEGEQSTAAL